MGKGYTNQHIVPQSYLKRFAEKNSNNGKYHICVFSKSRKVGKGPFIRSIKDVGFIKNYYDVSIREDPKYWEHFIDRNIENKSERTINGVISKITLQQLEHFTILSQEKVTIARFLGFQMMRVPPFFDNRVKTGMEIGKQMWDFVQKKFGNRLTYDQNRVLTQNMLQTDGIKDLVLESMTDEKRLYTYTAILCSKKWLFIYNNSDIPFFTSDNPVVLQNIHDQSIGTKNTGIGRSDSLVFYPLSSHIMIEMLPRGLLTQEQIEDGRVFLNNDDYKYIRGVNQLQYMHATDEIYFAPWFETGFKAFYCHDYDLLL